MEITNSVTVLATHDIALPTIAKLFKPTDDQAVELLRKGAPEDYLGMVTSFSFEKDEKLIIAICTAPSGKTHRGVSKSIKEGGWHYGGLADWCRYKEGGGKLGSENVSLMSQIYRDENFNEWFSRVYYREKTIAMGLKNSLSAIFRKGKNRDQTIAGLSMKPMLLNTPFRHEIKFLVVKIEETKKLK